ncbi:GNAT family N-acetyltransferase [Aliamphritea ceti]|uniref:GNAT family N-acetyltransferase n=1 Tax=Aliamphritea ceti TaxID=1524258 RepID=UPI0021C415C0|nr:GNAT family N-acetyltransferase [Aliamphritea ceti]
MRDSDSFNLKVDDEIQLELVAAEMAPVFQRLVTDNYEPLARWMQWPRYCKTVDDFSHFIARERQNYRDGSRMSLAIVYRGLIVGTASFNVIDREVQRTDIGYWLIPDYQGLGIVTRACKAMLNYAFEQLDVSKVQITVAEDNLPSRAVCERLGMQLEGIISHSEKIGERILNHAIYAAFKASEDIAAN